MSKQIAILIAFIATIVVNALSNALPLNGQTTSDISNKLNVLFTPAGYVFSIWGFIYLLVLIWIIIQFRKKETTQAVTTYFIASCIFNIAWLFTWHYELFAISILFMLLLLVTLILLYKQYPHGDARFGGRFPFSFYLGWISVATIANISYVLKHYDVSLGIPEVGGTIGLVIIASALAIFGRYYSNDPYYAIVFVWAIVGIAESNSNSALVTVCYVAAIIIFIAIVALSFVGKRHVATTY